MGIHVLEDQVIAQIAAGEVIERPASVIKELTENALDAGASNVHIEVTGSGKKLIRVSDDGHGIPSEEVELAFARHATSKLQTTDDLMAIQTLGFRGEALASIAAVSHVSLTTRHQSEATGTKLLLEGGRIQQRKSTGAPRGTVITVENLFYNTPARLKFLKAENTEKRHIASVVTRYAMAYPNIRFVLHQDGREVFRSGGTGQLSDVLVAALGLDTFKDMLELPALDSERDSISVVGYTSMPSIQRADRSRITLFVNGRWVQDSSLSYAVVQAYHTFLMKGRYPVAVVMITVPPDLLDVNVHPAKAEVRFQDPNAVFAAVQRAIRRAIIDHSETPALRGGRSFSDFNWDEDTAPQKTWQMGLGIEMESPGSFSHQSSGAERETGYDHTIPFGPTSPARPRTLPMLRVIGQVGASYIVAEGPAGLYLVDQHAAHERILYEQFMLEYAQKEPLAQFTLSSQTIELPAPEARLIEENIDVLQAVGFKLEPFGTNTFVIRCIPALLSDQDPLEAVGGIIDELEMGKTPGHASIEEKIIQRVCKQAAVKAGTVLSMQEMQGLIRQLERCQSPLTCPHGRPTMLHMSSDELAREFGRK
ncbi:MAG: DNA mismatch repair endonuclease MutL [Anaerolineae bacterium]|nr:DNA mismatch repair endonuclease MutL [Anaerolineae bacterium]